MQKATKSQRTHRSSQLSGKQIQFVRPGNFNLEDSEQTVAQEYSACIPLHVLFDFTVAHAYLTYFILLSKKQLQQKYKFIKLLVYLIMYINVFMSLVIFTCICTVHLNIHILAKRSRVWGAFNLIKQILKSVKIFGTMHALV